MKLGSNIKKYRKEKGLTQEKLAYDLGVSAQAVSRWENDITYPDISMLPILADYFETSIDDLMGRMRECPLEERENFFKTSRECSDSVEGQISLYREMLKKYPNDTYIQFGLSNLLYILYKCNANLELEEEIKQLCSRIEQSHKPDMQCGARRTRALLCIQNKDFETAKKLINALPSYRCGREVMMERLIEAMQNC